MTAQFFVEADLLLSVPLMPLLMALLFQVPRGIYYSSGVAGPLLEWTWLERPDNSLRLARFGAGLTSLKTTSPLP
jgi:hypothetical protein